MGNIFGSCVQKSEAEQAPTVSDGDAGKAVEETTPAVDDGANPTTEEPKADEVVSDDAVDVKLTDEQEPAKGEETAESNQADTGADAGADASTEAAGGGSE